MGTYYYYVLRTRCRLGHGQNPSIVAERIDQKIRESKNIRNTHMRKVTVELNPSLSNAQMKVFPYDHDKMHGLAGMIKIFSFSFDTGTFLVGQLFGLTALRRLGQRSVNPVVVGTLPAFFTILDAKASGRPEIFC